MEGNTKNLNNYTKMVTESGLKLILKIPIIFLTIIFLNMQNCSNDILFLTIIDIMDWLLSND